MKFGFVAKHRGAWPVNLMCEALGVSRGGFYACAPGAGAALKTRSWALRCTRASCAATAPMAPGACGAMYWSRASLVACTASSGSCASRRFAPVPGAGACPRTGASAVRLPTTCWTASSRPTHRTRNGWPTSPTSGPPKAGCTWQRCWTCTRVASWAGRCKRA